MSLWRKSNSPSQGQSFRKAFDDIVDNVNDVGRRVFVRSMEPNRKCHCVRSTGEPDPRCPDCGGLGFMYTDHPAKCYFVHTDDTSKAPIELGNYIGVNAYLSVDSRVKRIDQIIEVQCLDNGEPVYPFRITKIHNIKSLRRLAGDPGGALSFYKAVAAETVRGGTTN